MRSGRLSQTLAVDNQLTYLLLLRALAYPLAECLGIPPQRGDRGGSPRRSDSEGDVDWT